MDASPLSVAWPAAHEWSAAIQNPHLAFNDAFLKGAVPAVDKHGMPVVSSGNFAYVFKLVNSGTSRAVRCFSRYVPDRQQRYEAISKQLDDAELPFIVGFDYDLSGIRVNGAAYPVLVMDWLSGDTLDVYLDQVVAKRDVISYIADEWLRLVAKLESAQVAHGDLQHGNVLVCSGELKLVDLDAMFVPSLRGRRSLELGHPAYQHPARSNAMFDERLDRFSAMVIYASLKALAVEPALWGKYHDENLIFARKDYLQPRASAAFKDCLALGGDVAALVEALIRACEREVVDVPTLSTFAKVKTSGLPAWMQAVPPGGLTAAPKTREAGLRGNPGRSEVPPVDTATPQSAVRRPSPPSVHAAGPKTAVSTAGTVPARQATRSWGDRFAAGFAGAFKAIWGLPIIAMLTANAVIVVMAAMLVVVISLIAGISAAANSNTSWSMQRQGTPYVPRQSPAPTTFPGTTPAPGRTPPRTIARRTQPSRPQSVPLYLPPSSPATSAGGAVVASRIRTIYHRPSCEWALKMSRRNKITFSSATQAGNRGYRACRICRP